MVGFRELGNGDGESDAVEVGLGGERSGVADFEDFVWVLLGFEEGECRSGLGLGGEWGGGVLGEDR